MCVAYGSGPGHPDGRRRSSTEPRKSNDVTQQEQDQRKGTQQEQDQRKGTHAGTHYSAGGGTVRERSGGGGSQREKSRQTPFCSCLIDYRPNESTSQRVNDTHDSPPLGPPCCGMLTYFGCFKLTEPSCAVVLGGAALKTQATRRRFLWPRKARGVDFIRSSFMTTTESRCTSSALCYGTQPPPVGGAWSATHTSLAPPLLPPLKAGGQTASLREFYNGSELSALCLVSVGE